MSAEPTNPDGVIAMLLWIAVFIPALVILQLTGNATLFYLLTTLSFVALMVPYLYRRLSR